jgi:hypothetical protein
MVWDQKLRRFIVYTYFEIVNESNNFATSSVKHKSLMTSSMAKSSIICMISEQSLS